MSSFRSRSALLSKYMGPGPDEITVTRRRRMCTAGGAGPLHTISFETSPFSKRASAYAEALLHGVVWLFSDVIAAEMLHQRVFGWLCAFVSAFSSA